MHLPVRRLVLLCLPLLLGATLRAESPSAATDEWTAYQAALSAPPDRPYEQLTPLERHQWIEKRMLKARELGLAFIEKNPSDPRRWNVVANFTSRSPRFVKEWGALNEKGIPTAPIVDEQAAAAWTKQVDELKTAMRQAADLPDDLRMQLTAQAVSDAINSAILVSQRGGDVDLAALRAQLQTFATSYPTSPAGSTLLLSYGRLVEKAHPEQIENEWRLFTASPNRSIAEVAKGKLEFVALAKKPLEIAFTAVDGREVNLAQLRGKVVLIDFWATWCGPCIAELPNVRKVYEAYHDKGFEILGITLEDGRLKSTDTPEQITAKLTKAKKILTDFTAKESMPWPQYFDGKFWKNDLSTRYAISAIPAMFLLDQEGRIVSTNARGPKLEAEVKRLLGL